MASTITNQKYVSDSFTIGALGLVYDVTGLTASDKPAPDGKTVFNITVPTGYEYKETTFLFSASANLSNPISPDGIVVNTTAGVEVMVVTFTSTNLNASTQYFISFDLTA